MSLPAPKRVDAAGQALAAAIDVVRGARRRLWIRSLVLDPGVLDTPAFIDAIRSFATGTPAREIWILLHDAATVESTHAPLLALAQRLPSVFSIREITEAGDRADSSACIVNDAGGYYRRALGLRWEGEAGEDRARAHQLIQALTPVWERSRPCSEFRALGL